MTEQKLRTLAISSKVPHRIIRDLACGSPHIDDDGILQFGKNLGLVAILG